MSSAKSSSKQFKNSLYVLFAFFPVFNSMAFFHMYGRVRNKKYSLMGWLFLILNLVFIIAMFLIPNIQNPNERPQYYNIVDWPEAVDFMNDEQYKKYRLDSSYVYSDEFKLSDEYVEYQKNYEQYTKDMRVWEKTPEIAEQIEKYESFNRRMTTVSIAFVCVFFVLNIVIVMLVFMERPRFLYALEQEKNKSVFSERMNTVKQNIPVRQPVSMSPEMPKLMKTPQEKVNINTCTEEELEQVTGLSIIDVKKAVAYRNESNGFESVDEFFSVINAKPHIIAKMQNLIILGEFKGSDAMKEADGKRKIDI